MEFPFWPLSARLVPWRPDLSLAFGAGDGSDANRPAVNVWADDQSVQVEAELPGVAEDALEITVVENELTIAGRREPDLGEHVRVLRRERPTGEFRRVVALPFEVAADEVDATLEHGVLTVRLPKAPSARPRTIPVNASNEGSRS